jgi:hypothetical protein
LSFLVIGCRIQYLIRFISLKCLLFYKCTFNEAKSRGAHGFMSRESRIHGIECLFIVLIVICHLTPHWSPSRFWDPTLCVYNYYDFRILRMGFQVCKNSEINSVSGGK